MTTRLTHLARTQHRHGITLMLISTSCFTANILLVRALGQHGAVSAWFLVCVRFITGLAVVSTVYRREFAPRHLLTNPRLILRGVVGGLATGLTYLTIVKLGAGRATFIGNTYVIWAGLIAVWALGEKFHRPLALGCMATLSGIALLTNVIGTGLHPGFYDVVALLSAFGAAIAVVLIRQLHAREHTATIFAAQCAYGLLICGGPAVIHFIPLSASAWALVALASGCAAAGQLSMTRAFRDLPVGEGSLLQMLVPLGVAVGGVMLFQENFTPVELIGAVLILIGTALPALSGRR
jgi:drug/metabolite transporter (DMT)-like permease